MGIKIKNQKSKIKKNYILFFIFIFAISSLIFNFVVIADDDIAITGTVPPTQSDFQFDFDSTDGKTTVPQGETLSYEISYGALNSAGFTTTNTIVADFNDNILDYVLGSAGNGYGGAQPVVDLNNKTITWTISLPKNVTNQTITFQLKTNSNNTSSNPVDFTVKAKMNNQYVNMPDKSIDQTYQYDLSLVTPTPTPTPGPTSTPGPGPTSTPTPTPTPTNLQIADISFTDISESTSTINVNTSTPSKLTIKYGTSARSLSQSQTTSKYQLANSINLNDLQANTTYYFQVIATDTSGNRIASDIFTFKTAISSSEKPNLDLTSIIITSSDIVLFAAGNDSKTTPGIVLPQGSVYSFRFKLDNYEAIKKIEAIVRSKVLGITSEDDDISQTNTSGVEIINHGNGLFEGRLKTPTSPGSYEIFARIWDTNGNLTENKLTEMNVAPPLTILDQNNTPIENAQVLLYFQNSKTKKYQVLSPQVFPIKNPSYTDRNGQTSIPLPQGNYKIKITAIGYKTKEINFSIIGYKTDAYPKIILEKEPFNLITLGQYYLTIIQDGIQLTRLYIQGLSQSLRFFELNALIVTAVFVFVTLFSFSRRINIPLRFLFEYFKHLARIQSIQKKVGNQITGRIFDSEDGQTLADANIYLIDQKTGSIVGHTISDDKANFHLIKLPATSYALQIMKQGYEPAIFVESEIQAVGLGGYSLQIHKHTKGIKSAEKVKIFFEKMLSVLFETLLIIALGFELAFGFALGWVKVLPFLAISITNLTLWLIHLTHLRNQKNVF
jgi:hypothetical protein